MNLLFLRGTFQYFFRKSEIGRIDIFKSFFRVCFEAKRPKIELLHNLLTIDAFFLDGWQKILHWPEFGTNICQIKWQFWGGISLLICSKNFSDQFLLSLC